MVPLTSECGVLIPYDGNTYLMPLIDPKDIRGMGKLKRIGELEVNVVYSSFQIWRVTNYANCYSRMDNVLTFWECREVDTENKTGLIRYDGDTFEKISIKEEDILGSCYKFLACLIVGLDYYPLDIELIRIKATYYYKVGRVYFFYIYN